MTTTNVRYANSGGISVRNTAAGTKITTLNAGTLMYDIPGITTVTASLKGTSYVWVKVCYYKINSDNSTTTGNGWVAKSATTQVSNTVPSKSSTYSSNSVLTQNKMLVNATYIYNYLSNKGWSNNAICALLGNMETESSINPGRWQNGKVNTSLGYGLTQWTPSTKYTNWLSSSADKGDIDNQLKRILYEVSRGNIQWNSSKLSPSMTFSEFTTSTKTTSSLTEYFFKCYEQSQDTSSNPLSIRQSNATKWSTLIGFLVS